MLPTRRRVNGVRFIRHPIRYTCSAVPRPCAPSSTTGPSGHPIDSDALCIERHKDPLSAPDPLSGWEHGPRSPCDRSREAVGDPCGQLPQAVRMWGFWLP